MKNRFLCTVMLFVFFVFAGECSARDVLVFFDVSGSIKKEVVKEYFAGYREVVSELKAGDTVATSMINSNTRGNFEPVGGFVVKSKGTFESPTGYAEEVEDLKNNSLLRVKKSLEKIKPAGNTDILSALVQAKVHFDKSTDSSKKIVVIFSDMVEETAELNLRHLTTKDVDKAFGKIRKKVPMLDGVKIYVAGVKGTSPDQFQALEIFWKKVFAVAKSDCVFFGAKLYDFGKW